MPTDSRNQDTSTQEIVGKPMTRKGKVGIVEMRAGKHLAKWNTKSFLFLAGLNVKPSG